MYHHPDMVKCPHWLKAFVRQAPKMEGFILKLLHSFFWAVIYFRSSCRGAWTSRIRFLEECQKFTCQRCQIWWWRAGSWTRSVTPVSMCCSRREVMSQQPVTADLASGWSGFFFSDDDWKRVHINSVGRKNYLKKKTDVFGKVLWNLSNAFKKSKMINRNNLSDCCIFTSSDRLCCSLLQLR